MRPYESDGLTAYRQLPMVVVLPETSTWRAHAVADDVRGAIGSIHIDGFGSLSACTGVDAAHGDLQAAVERADRQLYEAKRSREATT